MKINWFGIAAPINCGIHLGPMILLARGQPVPAANYVISALAITFLAWAYWKGR